jgi:hypothetical protein
MLEFVKRYVGSAKIWLFEPGAPSGNCSGISAELYGRAIFHRITSRQGPFLIPLLKTVHRDTRLARHTFPRVLIIPCDRDAF